MNDRGSFYWDAPTNLSCRALKSFDFMAVLVCEVIKAFVDDGWKFEGLVNVPFKELD